MEERTVNGYTKDELIEKLSAEFDTVEKSHDGFPTIKIEQYQQRMREVVGICNYDYIVGEPKVVTIDGQTTVYGTGTLIIHYDDGEVFTTKSAYGSTVLAKSRTSGENLDLSKAIKSCDSDIFKACCKKLNIGDGQLRALKKKIKGEGNGAASSSSTKEQADTTIRVQFTDLPKKMGTKGVKVAAVTEDGELVNVVLWNSLLALIPSKYTLEEFVKIYSENQLTVVGDMVKRTYNGKEEQQLIVKEFAKKKSA